MEITTDRSPTPPPEATNWILVRAFGAQGGVVEGLLSPDHRTASEAAADLFTRPDVARVELTAPGR